MDHLTVVHRAVRTVTCKKAQKIRLIADNALPFCSAEVYVLFVAIFLAAIHRIFSLLDTNSEIEPSKFIKAIK